MSKTVQLGTKIVAGIPEWMFEHVNGLRELREQGVVQGVLLVAKNNGAMEVAVSYIPKDEAKQGGAP